MPEPSNARPSTPEHGVVIARNTGMRARDGTWLATDLYRPARDGESLPGPFPAILVRTPYDKRLGAEGGEFWARHGYVAAYQDVRGRFESEGEFVLLANEGPDGYDAVEWLAELPFCDGNVGTAGTSYLAWVQNALAIERPPHLRAMWVNEGGANGNVSALRHNGAMELRWLTWAVSHGARSPEASRDPALRARLVEATEHMYEWLKRLPWGPGNTPLEGLPGYARWAEELYTHGDADAYWLRRGLNFEPHYDETADVPTVYAGSWYDSYTRATTDNFAALKGRLAHQHLLMGPWTHGEVTLNSSHAGGVDLGPAAPIPGNLAESSLHLRLRWFDRWLKGVENGVEQGPAVKLFVMGGGGGAKTAEGRLMHGGAWRDEPDWPLARAVATDYYLHPGGALRGGEPPPETARPSAYTADPGRPVPTVAANTSSLNEIVPTPPRVRLDSPLRLMRVMVIQGGADQVTGPDVLGAGPPYGPLAYRPDVLAFSTEPLAEAVEVTGPVEVTLYVSSDAPDGDLFAMLLDVYPRSAEWPDGYRLNISDGIMRLRYREGMASPKLMTPGTVYEVRFNLYPTSNVFDAGHRMQLLIAGSSFPRFDINPNTGEPIGRHTRTQVAHCAIHHDAAHPSMVTLPLVPRREGAG